MQGQKKNSGQFYSSAIGDNIPYFLKLRWNWIRKPMQDVKWVTDTESVCNKYCIYIVFILIFKDHITIHLAMVNLTDFLLASSKVVPGQIQQG